MCDGCTSPLCVGVSIHTAIAADNVVNGLWVINPASYTSTEATISKWLTHVQEDVNRHIVDPTQRELRYGALQTLHALPRARSKMTRVPAVRLFRNLQPAPSQGNAQLLRIGYLVGLGDKGQPTSASSPFEGAVRVQACRVHRVRPRRYKR